MNEQQRWDAALRDGNPFHQFLGVEIVERGDGTARVRLPMTEKVRGGVAGSFHGGVLSALADIATLAAMQTVFTPSERAAGTAELSISYLRPALGPYVSAVARVLKKGRTLAVVDVDMHDPDGRLVAKARVSYALRPQELAERASRMT
jgi:uncharacterized protein (TIGR00369 family)